jgi:hypothetical protein
MADKIKLNTKTLGEICSSFAQFSSSASNIASTNFQQITDSWEDEDGVALSAGMGSLAGVFQRHIDVANEETKKFEQRQNVLEIQYGKR